MHEMCSVFQSSRYKGMNITRVKNKFRSFPFRMLREFTDCNKKDNFCLQSNIIDSGMSVE